MKSLALLFAMFFIFNQTSLAQEDEKFIDVDENKKEEPKKRISDKIVFGGNFGLTFGTITNIDLSPTVGYKVVPQILLGTSFSYQYFKNNEFDYKYSIYGAGLFTQVSLGKQLFLHAEAQKLNIEFYDKGINYGRRWVDCVLVGGGYRQYITERASVNLMVLWDLIQSTGSPYTNPVIRVSFNF